MDELNRPLGNNVADKPAGYGRYVGIALMATLVLGTVGYAGWTVVKSTNEQVAVAKLEDAAKPTPAADSSAKTQAGTESELPAESQNELAIKPLSPLEPASPSTTPTIVTPSTGKQPSFAPQAAPKSRRSAGFPNSDLVEASEFGPLPKIGSSGRRALDEYSQSTGTVGANRVAIIVGGLGLSQSGTQEAIKALPSGITLGFSSMGNSLQRWVQVARQEGHEVILQIPMEPLGYPSISPGPKTLTSKATLGGNLGNLRWSLGRMTNYPLVMNYLGAGLISNRQSMEPILEEIKKRGLGYLDDGSVTTSQAIAMAKASRLPNAQASVTLDLNQNPAQIDAQLNTLQSLARQKGFAIGVATAFPVSIERITRWAKNAQGSDLQIVPVSNLIRDYKR